MADRDSSGKFVKGAKTGGARPGAGRKPLTRSLILEQVVTEQDWAQIYAALRDQAKAGDLKCAEFLDVRRFGKITDASDESTEVPQITVTFHQPLPPPESE